MNTSKGIKTNLNIEEKSSLGYNFKIRVRLTTHPGLAGTIPVWSS
jgi:hypothetical protein